MGEWKPSPTTKKEIVEAVEYLSEIAKTICKHPNSLSELNQQIGKLQTLVEYLPETKGD